MTAATIDVSVSWVGPSVQEIVPLVLPAGATAAQAVARSGLVEAHAIDLAAVRFGIRGRLARADTRLQDGDRVDICRPLLADPGDARRARARLRAGRQPGGRGDR